MPSRRAVLTGVTAAVVGTSGCLFGERQARGATDVVVHNESSSERSVSVTVTHGEETRIDRTLELPVAAATTINNEVLMDADYTVDIDVADGPTETHEWTDAGKPMHVIVDDSENVVFAVQVG